MYIPFGVKRQSIVCSASDQMILDSKMALSFLENLKLVRNNSLSRMLFSENVPPVDNSQSNQMYRYGALQSEAKTPNSHKAYFNELLHGQGVCEVKVNTFAKCS